LVVATDGVEKVPADVLGSAGDHHPWALGSILRRHVESLPERRDRLVFVVEDLEDRQQVRDLEHVVNFG
jgi:hypothetical protein